MATIRALFAREILDSRGTPTIEVEVEVENGIIGRASVPSGASKGVREAIELRDGERRYRGLGVQKAIAALKEVIAPALLGKDISDQAHIDHILLTLDGTPNKSNLGANTLLAVSLAAVKAAAAFHKTPLYHYLGRADRYCLPVPMMNIINGGMHVDNTLNIQEFMILPIGASRFSEALRYGSEVTYALKKRLIQCGLSTAVGDEGGFGPNLPSHCAALEIILEAIADAGFIAGQDISLALDLASSTFYRQGRYCLDLEGQSFSSEQFVEYLSKWIDDYPILSIEDAMAEDDQEGWQIMTAQLGQKIQIVGDDLFVTSAELLKKGITEKVANAILIKPNQVGTLTETLATIKVAKAAEYGTIISHRSGETEDTVIADLAIATNAAQIKTGALCRSERVAKYNELLRIEEALSEKGYYAGKSAYNKVRKNV